MSTQDVPGDVARLITLWGSPDYDEGDLLSVDQRADEGSATWCVWEGGPFVHHARASAARCDRWWRENRKTDTDTQNQGG